MPYAPPWGEMPYDDVPPQHLHRTNIDVARHDSQLLQSILPERGQLTFFVQSYIKSLATYARNNQLAYGDGPKLLAYVKSTCLCHSPATQPLAEASLRDERGGTSGLLSNPSHGENKPAKLQQAPKGGRGQGGKTKVGKK